MYIVILYSIIAIGVTHDFVLFDQFVMMISNKKCEIVFVFTFNLPR